MLIVLLQCKLILNREWPQHDGMILIDSYYWSSYQSILFIKYKLMIINKKEKLLLFSVLPSKSKHQSIPWSIDKYHHHWIATYKTQCSPSNSDVMIILIKNHIAYYIELVVHLYILILFSLIEKMSYFTNLRFSIVCSALN